ncbi:MAG: aminotransferase class IV, partial [Verrucomicrobia bacterium]|nr:aminotransferase class IV [Verrucomicrobiota bacterium]
RNERSASAGAKCSSYADNILALGAAHSRGAGEAVFANTRGELCEGATTNVFIVRNGRTFTPPLSSGCLPGITRELVLECCCSHGDPIEEKKLSFSALLQAEEAFLTSSIRGVQPISHIDGRKLTHAPGSTTRRIASLYQKLVRQHDDP